MSDSYTAVSNCTYYTYYNGQVVLFGGSGGLSHTTYVEGTGIFILEGALPSPEYFYEVYRLENGALQEIGNGYVDDGIYDENGMLQEWVDLNDLSLYREGGEEAVRLGALWNGQAMTPEQLQAALDQYRSQGKNGGHNDMCDESYSSIISTLSSYIN